MGIDCSQFLRRPARGYSSKSGLRRGAFQATMVAGQANVYRHQHAPRAEHPEPHHRYRGAAD